MKRHLSFWSILLPAFLLVGSVRPSWAHFHGRFGLYIGPGFWNSGPYYDPYYDYPYPYPYYPYYPYEPYAYVPYARVEAQPQQERVAKPDESRHDLTYIEGQLAQAREQIVYEYEDGDITKEQRRNGIHHLKNILDEARAEAKSNSGYITGEQQNELLDEIRGRSSRTRTADTAPATEMSGISLATVDQQIARLRNQLDQKLKVGNITKAQHDGMVDYLARTEKQARSQASANGGTLTHDQEEALRQQLERVEQTIEHNLVIN
jgi:hypothetical protein